MDAPDRQPPMPVATFNDRDDAECGEVDVCHHEGFVETLSDQGSFEAVVGQMIEAWTGPRGPCLRYWVANTRGCHGASKPRLCPCVPAGLEFVNAAKPYQASSKCSYIDGVFQFVLDQLGV